MAEVSDYDKYNYDYQDYWKERDYENKAEENAIGSLIRPHYGKRFIDIGGSYGRNLPLYSNKYQEVVIMDYSLQTLQKYEKQILDQFPNAKLVAGNVYEMPFIDGSFDGALMVRVLHHIQEPEKYFRNLATLLKKDGVVIQEFANKVHIKAKLKWLFTGNFKNLDQTPYQQKTRLDEEKEGSKEESIFLNFHPKHIKKMLKENSFKIDARKGCSYLRIGFIKRTVPEPLIVAVEKLLQALFSWTNLPPSIFFLAHNENGIKDKTEKPFNEIITCPKCHNNKQLKIAGDTATCEQCNSTYQKHSTIWDLRA